MTCRDRFRNLRMVLCVLSYTLYVIGGLYTVALIVFLVFFGLAIAIGGLSYIALTLILVASVSTMSVVSYYVAVKDPRFGVTIGLMTLLIALEYMISHEQSINAIIVGAKNNSTADVSVIDILPYLAMLLVLTIFIYMSYCFLLPNRCKVYRLCKHRIYEPLLT